MTVNLLVFDKINFFNRRKYSNIEKNSGIDKM